MNNARNMDDLISYVVTSCILSDYVDEYAADLMVTLVKEILANEDNFPKKE